jgi:nucleoside-diphosphate-sugar epimerase
MSPKTVLLTRWVVVLLLPLPRFDTHILEQAVKSNPPFDYVLHTASPFHFNVQDPVKDFLDPAIKGTTGILHAIKAHAPEVKRVVITSSFAAIVNPKQHPKVYNEENWNPVTWEEAMDPSNVYRASKVN